MTRKPGWTAEGACGTRGGKGGSISSVLRRLPPMCVGRSGGAEKGGPGAGARWSKGKQDKGFPLVGAVVFCPCCVGCFWGAFVYSSRSRSVPVRPPLDSGSIRCPPFRSVVLCLLLYTSLSYERVVLKYLFLSYTPAYTGCFSTATCVVVCCAGPLLLHRAYLAKNTCICAVSSSRAVPFKSPPEPFLPPPDSRAAPINSLARRSYTLQK